VSFANTFGDGPVQATNTGTTTKWKMIHHTLLLGTVVVQTCLAQHVFGETTVRCNNCIGVVVKVHSPKTVSVCWFARSKVLCHPMPVHMETCFLTAPNPRALAPAARAQAMDCTEAICAQWGI
jgi:hypothetical protein